MHLLDPFRASVGVLPLAVYLLVIGGINLRRRPLLTTGGRDLYALALAVSGFITIGPIELFMPEAAQQNFGAGVWLLLAGFYFLSVTLIALLMRPRLIIYNTSIDEIRSVLAKLVKKLDEEHRWAGNSLLLPNLGVQLLVDRFPLMRNVTLVATSGDQSFAGWRYLERELAAELSDLEVPPNSTGVFFVTISTLLFCAVGYWVLHDPDAVVRNFELWLH